MTNAIGAKGRGEGRRTGIPDLQAYDSVGITVDDPLRHEARADGAGRLGGVESALAVPRDERRLADALGAQDDDLGLEGGHVVFCVVAYLVCRGSLFVCRFNSQWFAVRSPRFVRGGSRRLNLNRDRDPGCSFRN